MPINADKPHLWKADIAKSVDMFNNWFMRFAPKAYRDTRIEVTQQVRDALRITENLRSLSTATLKHNPSILPTLRMTTCPPLARDRLVGLAYANKNLISTLENGNLPVRMAETELEKQLERICKTISKMLDTDIFPWLEDKAEPTEQEQHRASTIVADRLCGAVSNPIIRNAQECRQLAYIQKYLKGKGYHHKPHPPGVHIKKMEPGTFSFRTNVVVGTSDHSVNIPIDCIIQPKKTRRGKLPILIEAKSAGDFTNTNKRRKEEATKVRQLRDTYGKNVQFLLFLCGYFDGGYLGYEAAEGIDWIWEHRIDDMVQLGL